MILACWAGSAAGQTALSDVPVDHFYMPFGTVNALVEHNGTIYLGGDFTVLAPHTGSGVVIDADTGARQSGWPKTDGDVVAAIADGSGGWFIAGDFTKVGNVPRCHVARIRSDGTVDQAFDVDIGSGTTCSPAGATVFSLALSNDLSWLYLGGNFTQINGATHGRLVSVDADTGAVRPGWGNANANGAVNQLVLSPDDNALWVGGAFTMIGAQQGSPTPDRGRNRLAALDPVTGTVLPCDPNADEAVGLVRALALAPGGNRLYLAGGFSAPMGQPPRTTGLAAIDVASCALSDVWVTSTSAAVEAIAVSPNASTVYIGGSFTGVGTQNRHRVAALAAADGSVDLNFDSEVNDGGVMALALSRDGQRLYLGGAFTRVENTTRNRLAALELSGELSAWNPDADGAVETLAVGVAGLTVYAGGRFVSVGDRVQRNHLAALDLADGRPTAWNPNASHEVEALAMSPDGEMLYVAGGFTTMGGEIRNHVAAIDVETVAVDVLPWNPNADRAVTELAVSPDGSRVYLGARIGFSTIGGESRLRLASVDGLSGAVTDWNPQLGSGAGGINAIVAAADGQSVYLAGAFNNVLGGTRNRLARVRAEDNELLTWHPNADAEVETLISALSRPTPTLYLGGTFTNLKDNDTVRFLAEVDAETEEPTGWRPQVTGSTVTVTALALSVDGSTVYLGGQFTRVGGEPRAGIAAVDTTSGGPLDWNPGLTGGSPLNGIVNTIVGAQGTVYVGGDFDRIGGESRAHFAAFAVVPITPTLTPSNTPTGSPTRTATSSRTATHTRTPAPTASPNGTVTPTRTSSTATVTDTPTSSASPSTSAAATPTGTPTRFSTPTVTGTADPTLTSTLTPSRTPTPCPSATPCPPQTVRRCSEDNPCDCSCEPTEGVDFVAVAVEVVQAVQDLDNGVRQVAGKRTFVRFHVRARGEERVTTARLRVERGGESAELFPLNPDADGTITVRAAPDRAARDDAFLFAVPSRFLAAGELVLTAEVNPVLDGTVRLVAEDNTADNTLSTSVRFEDAPSQTVVLYRVRYEHDGEPPDQDRTELALYLQRAFPLSDLEVVERTYFAGTGVPTCAEVNAYLLSKRFWDLAFGAPLPPHTRYYGQVSDEGDFTPGCAVGVPSFVAAGPTGIPGVRFGWDRDGGSYGDFYGAHELAHAWGRPDAPFCGAAGDAPYPHPDGRISTALEGRAALYGFDSFTQAIYPPASADLMTFCENVWVSDFTYEGLLDFYQQEQVTLGDEASRTDRLLVVGTIDPDSRAVALQPLFILANTRELKAPVPGPYAIVLRDAQDQELARYPFTPDTGVGGPEPERNVSVLFINELVPFRDGTTQVDVEVPGGTGFSVTAGSALPSVSVLEPSSGVVLAGETVTVSWTAADADGDPLTFNVQYSADDGATWEMIEQNLRDTSVEIAAANLASGARVRFRVSASDRIHTGSADSGSAEKPNLPPTVQITKPTSNALLLADSSFGVEAVARDGEGRSMRRAQVRWLLDGTEVERGTLGTVDTRGVSDGDHTLRVVANDGALESADQVEIKIGSLITVASCAGDCDGRGAVTVDELVKLVNIALGNAPIADCRVGDRNDDRRITISEIIQAVNLALTDCPP